MAAARPFGVPTSFHLIGLGECHAEGRPSAPACLYPAPHMALHASRVRWRARARTEEPSGSVVCCWVDRHIWFPPRGQRACSHRRLPSAARVSLQCVPGRGWIPAVLFSPTSAIPQPPGVRLLNCCDPRLGAESHSSVDACGGGFFVCSGVMCVSPPFVCD